MKDLDVLVDAAAADLAEAMRRDLLAPDFAAVVAEAHARDPKRVPAAALVEVRELAPVAQLRRDASARVPAREQAEFAALLAEARAEIDRDCAAVRAAGPPPVPVPRARRSATRPWMWLAAAAAVAALAFGVRPLLTRGQAGPEAANQAPFQDQASPSRHEVAPAPAPTRAERARPVTSAPAPVSEAEVAPIEVAPIEVAPIVEDVPKGMPEKAGAKDQPEKAAARPRGETLVERLRRLDGEAEAKWEAGDLAGAEALYRQIVGLAPGSRAADLAYGDLFSLARQRHGGDEEVALWRTYLQAFPRGRYADDARAGLCRRADEGQRANCWRDYLADFPSGVHRHQAARVLEGEP
ncbi:hypothetical protein SAMN02745121_00855 [Nannocystis exedens]|uniref:Tetratricopeptide repeat-containing protein n=1 Tax=Nannocystis exedens TaxID=54 RepID=A0A1I1TZU9_9BACT|nr:hypothetical protein [Nannocystis exedens]PCC71315.1 hypothetical protein NAEX_04389 [Nannocystis exedens]SFD64146.1 hypothetical protein SAMN02745121_00855 [Nannocystis exedens]